MHRTAECCGGHRLKTSHSPSMQMYWLVCTNSQKFSKVSSVGKCVWRAWRAIRFVAARNVLQTCCSGKRRAAALSGNTRPLATRARDVLEADVQETTLESLSHTCNTPHLLHPCTKPCLLTCIHTHTHMPTDLNHAYRRRNCLFNRRA